MEVLSLFKNVPINKTIEKMVSRLKNGTEFHSDIEGRAIERASIMYLQYSENPYGLREVAEIDAIKTIVALLNNWGSMRREYPTNTH